MKVTRLLHHSVNVEDRLDETRAFYAEVLGLDVEPGRPVIPGVEGAWFDAGQGGQIHLVDCDKGTGAIRPTDVHVCLGVEDLRATIAELDERAIPYLRGAQGDVVQIWIADPSGNVIELQHDPPP